LTSRRSLSRDVLYDLHHVKKLTYQEIAETLGISRSTVYNWLRKEGMHLRGAGGSKPKPRPDNEILHSLYVDQHLSCVEIAEIMYVCHTTACKWLHQAGIPSRPRGSGKHGRSHGHRNKLILPQELKETLRL